MRKTLCVLLLAACGDGLVDTGFSGEPKLKVNISYDGDYATLNQESDRLRLGLFWSKSLSQPKDVSELVEQPSLSKHVQLPFGANWTFFEEPRDDVYITHKSGSKFAVGMPFVYFDENDNHRWDTGEVLQARAPISLVVYAPEDLTAERAPSGIAVPKGYQLFGPMWCNLPPPPVPSAGDCGVKLDAPGCSKDSDCGTGGVCQLADPWPWPGGVCSLPDGPNSCKPQNARLYRNHRNTGRFWMRACNQDSDCRASPYHCDLAQGICLPNGNTHLRFATPVRPDPICRDLPAPP
jgi:hypothetical protein